MLGVWSARSRHGIFRHCRRMWEPPPCSICSFVFSLPPHRTPWIVSTREGGVERGGAWSARIRYTVVSATQDPVGASLESCSAYVHYFFNHGLRMFWFSTVVGIYMWEAFRLEASRKSLVFMAQDLFSFLWSIKSFCFSFECFRPYVVFDVVPAIRTTPSGPF